MVSVVEVTNIRTYSRITYIHHKEGSEEHLKWGIQSQRPVPYLNEVHWDISDIQFVRNKDY